jgi:hypothetical protein
MDGIPWPLKMASNFKHKCGGHVNLIIKDILFRNIDTPLHEVLKRKGKMKGTPCKR